MPGDDKCVYESPDGGQTVWKREMGSLIRTRANQDDDDEGKSDWYYGKLKVINDGKEWGAILAAAETNPELKSLVDQIRVYAALIKDYDK